jgi:hypothetical protein
MWGPPQEWSVVEVCLMFNWNCSFWSKNSSLTCFHVRCKCYDIQGVSHWCHEFKTGFMNASDCPRSEKPSTSSTIQTLPGPKWLPLKKYCLPSILIELLGHVNNKGVDPSRGHTVLPRCRQQTNVHVGQVVQLAGSLYGKLILVWTIKTLAWCSSCVK